MEELIPPFAYLQQLARAWRFRDRYAARIKYSGGLDESYNDLEDFLWAAFQNCWHVRDWIRNDTSIDRSVKDKIVAAAHSSKPLGIVQDMANGTKHFVTKKGARDAAITFHTDNDGATLCHHVIELEDGARLLAINVLDSALRAWAEILRANGLQYFLETPQSFP